MKPQNWNEQTIIITGGGDGLGFALAKRFHATGATLALFDQNAEKLERAKNGLGDKTHIFAVDVTDANAVRDAVARVLEINERVDVLVNCAGITGRTNVQSHEVDLDDYDRVMNINARGSLITSQAVLPSMLKRDYGRILHVASISGKEGNAGMLAYSMSKAAVVALAKVQGKEYALTGVTINAIAPAVIRTEMIAALPDAQVKYMTDKIPMNRCGTRDEFASMAMFIVSPDASFTTGFTWDLSGGRATY